MDERKLYVTADGLKKIEDELHYLKNVKRREIAERISEAKELGDLSENAEYNEAKEEQAIVESRVKELEQQLKNVVVIDHKKNSSTVQIGSTIRVKSGAQKTLTLTIVGSSEADPSQQKISNESPLGQAFLDQKVGATVTVSTPGGDTKYTIESIE
jgi:transcription elongation factor GreA